MVSVCSSGVANSPWGKTLLCSPHKSGCTMGPDLAYTPDPYGVLGDWRGAAQIAHERLLGALSDSSAAHFFDFPPSGREKDELTRLVSALMYLPHHTQSI